MSDAMILTPFFLDEPVPGLRPLASPDWQIIDADLPATDDKQQRMIVLHRQIKTAVSQAIQQGQRPVSIAGDCCTTLGVLAGIQSAAPPPTLIWFDAHGDFNTWETTPSGFLGGMPLAMLAGLGEQTMPAGVALQTLPAANIILTDGRDLDPGERKLVEQSGLVHLPDPTALLDYPLPAGPLYVHFDVDVINLDEAPAMNYPAAGGPSVADLSRVFQHLAASGQVTAVSVSAWNPEMDGADTTQQNVLSLLSDLLGWKVTG